MDLVELGAGSMDLVDLEFLELWCLGGKKWSGAVFLIWSCVELCQTRPKHAVFYRLLSVRRAQKKLEVCFTLQK
jgi:hypothetical protein